MDFPSGVFLWEGGFISPAPHCLAYSEGASLNWMKNNAPAAKTKASPGQTAAGFL